MLLSLSCFFYAFFTTYIQSLEASRHSSRNMSVYCDFGRTILAQSFKEKNKDPIVNAREDHGFTTDNDELDLDHRGLLLQVDD